MRNRHNATLPLLGEFLWRLECEFRESIDGRYAGVVKSLSCLVLIVVYVFSNTESPTWSLLVATVGNMCGFQLVGEILEDDHAKNETKNQERVER